MDGNCINVRKCKFIGVDGVICSVGSITESEFNKCSNVIIELCTPYFKAITIDKCNFLCCTDVVGGIREKGSITNCRFDDCTGYVIGGIIGAKNTTISFCEFNNWRGDQDSLWFLAMLFFSKSKGDYTSKVSHCIFKNANAGENFLIQGNISEKIDGYVVRVEDCSFIDCSTERKSRKLIKEYDTYQGLFKEHTIKTVCVTNNKGEYIL